MENQEQDQKVTAQPIVPAQEHTAEVVNEEQRINAIIQRRKVLLKLIAKHIRPTDVRIFAPIKDAAGKLVGGNIHFERSACEQILMWANARVVDVRIEKDRIEDDKGVYYDYETYGKVVFADGREMEVMGNHSTRSDFYGKEILNEKQADGTFKKIETWKPLSEVDIPSIKQASWTNMLNHACVRSMGLKGITVEDLQREGMDVNKIASQEFGRGARGGATVSPEDKKLQVEISNWLLEINGGDKEGAARSLVELTSFTGRDGKPVTGKRSPFDLTGQWLKQTHAKAFAKHAEHKKKNQIA